MRLIFLVSILFLSTYSSPIPSLSLGELVVVDDAQLEVMGEDIEVPTAEPTISPTVCDKTCEYEGEKWICCEEEYKREYSAAATVLQEKRNPNYEEELIRYRNTKSSVGEALKRKGHPAFFNLVMSSEQLLERLRKEVMEKKKDDIIREIVSQRISEFSGEPAQLIPAPPNSTNNLLSSRMEHLLSISTPTAGQQMTEIIYQNHKN